MADEGKRMEGGRGYESKKLGILLGYQPQVISLFFPCKISRCRGLIDSVPASNFCWCACVTHSQEVVVQENWGLSQLGLGLGKILGSESSSTASAASVGYSPHVVQVRSMRSKLQSEKISVSSNSE